MFSGPPFCAVQSGMVSIWGWEHAAEAGHIAVSATNGCQGKLGSEHQETVGIAGNENGIFFLSPSSLQLSQVLSLVHNC